MLAGISACGPSQEKRNDANVVYNTTLEIVEKVNFHDSAYVQCMQYLMREIQSPDLKKNKKKTKNITDSIALLDGFSDSLIASIAAAEKDIQSLRADKPNFDLFDSADSLLNKYNTIAHDIYPDINSRMNEISLPVKDAEYTSLLRLSYRADSVLNAAINNFNTESAAFYEKYGLKEFRK